MLSIGKISHPTSEKSAIRVEVKANMGCIKSHNAWDMDGNIDLWLWCDMSPREFFTTKYCVFCCRFICLLVRLFVCPLCRFFKYQNKRQRRFVMIIEQMSESYKYSRKLWSCSGKIALCARDNLDNQQNAFLEPTIAKTMLMMIYTEVIRIRKAILIVDDNENDKIKRKGESFFSSTSEERGCVKACSRVISDILQFGLAHITMWGHLL